VALWPVSPDLSFGTMNDLKNPFIPQNLTLAPR
jgi:hypothetical protein